MPADKRSQPSMGSLLPRPENTALDRVLNLAPQPVLPGESEEDFLALAAQVFASAEPKNGIEEILIRDIIDQTWEIQRLRRAKAGLLKLAWSDGLNHVLYDIGYEDDDDRNFLSENCMSGQKRAIQRVHKALSAAGLSLSEVTAKTLEIKLDSIERLDSMLASAEARRNNSLREIDRHRGAFGARMRAGIEEVEDAEYTDLETGVVHAATE